MSAGYAYGSSVSELLRVSDLAAVDNHKYCSVDDILGMVLCLHHRSVTTRWFD
jgi:hypothetical protein